MASAAGLSGRATFACREQKVKVSGMELQLIDGAAVALQDGGVSKFCYSRRGRLVARINGKVGRAGGNGGGVLSTNGSPQQMYDAELARHRQNVLARGIVQRPVARVEALVRLSGREKTRGP